MTLWELAGVVGAFNLMTFGQGPVMIPLLQTSLVARRRVLSTDELLYAFTIARVTPGQANSYVAAIGYMVSGMVGALVCTLVVIVPGYLMVPLEYGFGRIRTASAVRGFTRGLIAASIGLMFAATAEMARGALTSWIAWTVFGIAVLASAVLRWNTLLVLAVPSAVGLLLTLF